MSAQLQYLRAISCQVGNFTSPSGLDFANFRIQFRVERGDQQTPNSCSVTIFNVSDATASALTNGITNGEYTRILLSAGYPGNIGQIFDGAIRQVRVGRVDQKDTYVTITAQDGDEPYNFAVVAQSWAKGQLTPQTAIQKFIATMATAATQGGQPETTGGYGTSASQVAQSSNANIRGRVFFGFTRDEMREFARNNNLVWSIQDGQLTLIPATSYIPGEAVVLSPDSGLIGIPEQTQYGIEVRALLNPNLKIGTLVKIAGIINQAQQGLANSQATVIGNYSLLSGSGALSATGTYYVMQANHSGDTRGQEWYTDLICMSVDTTVGVEIPDNAGIFPGNGPMQAGSLNGSP